MRSEFIPCQSSMMRSLLLLRNLLRFIPDINVYLMSTENFVGSIYFKYWIGLNTDSYEKSLMVLLVVFGL